METIETPRQESGGIYNYFQGATINNLVINGNMTKNGTEHYPHEGKKEGGSVNDDQIARAITMVSGKDKPLMLQKHYVGIICVLQSMGWPRKFATCCTRINALPGHEQFPVKCDSNAIKSTQAFKFASVDYNEWKNYEPKPGEESGVFKECKYAADAFYETLENLSNNE